MRKILYVLWTWMFFISSSAVRANQPEPEKTLSERVELASHVIVGTAKKVSVIEIKDGKLQEVNPQPKVLDGDQMALVEIEVEEVMYPSDWKPKTTVKYLFGGGFFEMESIRKDTLGRKLIYLMSVYQYMELKEQGEVFRSSYSWHLAESLGSRLEIQAVLDERIRRETEAKNKKQQ